ncbi:MAG: trimethylamine methyltransferase family protein, partial [Anaerolineae bacterium]
MPGIGMDGVGSGVLSVLSDRELERIHNDSLRLLAETGLVIHDAQVVTLLIEAGGQVCDMNGKRRLTIPGEAVADAVSAAPAVVRLYNRLGEEAMVVGTGRLHARTSSGATAIFDR